MPNKHSNCLATRLICHSSQFESHTVWHTSQSIKRKHCGSLLHNRSIGVCGWYMLLWYKCSRHSHVS
jgi:hypothetical protein